MATKEELTARIAEIDEAMASPERQVTLGSQNITYRSIADLEAARALLKAQLDALDPPRSLLKGRRVAIYRGRGCW